MGRKNITSKRLVEILDGKLLRFTDIQKTYKKLYKKKAFQQISMNLKLLQLKGVVSYICGHYYLAKDSETGKIREEQIQLAREYVEIYTKKMEDIEKTLEKILYLFAVGLTIEIPFHLVWDKNRIRKLILKQQAQLKQLIKILELDRS